MQQLTSHFWIRWSKECLGELQTRTKWHENLPMNVKIDTLVLLRDQNQPPLRWKLGRVQQLHPGKDGVLRVVTVNTADSGTKRTVWQICTLPDSVPTE